MRWFCVVGRANITAALNLINERDKRTHQTHRRIHNAPYQYQYQIMNDMTELWSLFWVLSSHIAGNMQSLWQINVLKENISPCWNTRLDYDRVKLVEKKTFESLWLKANVSFAETKNIWVWVHANHIGTSFPLTEQINFITIS